MEGGGKYKGFWHWKAGPKLGGPLPSHYNGESWSVLLGRHGGKTTPLTLEHKQLEKVLPLGATVMMGVLCYNCLKKMEHK